MPREEWVRTPLYLSTILEQLGTDLEKVSAYDKPVNHPYIQELKNNLHQRYWKDFSLEFEQESFAIKTWAADISFGDDDLDSDMVPYLISLGKQDVAGKILAKYKIVPNESEWELLRDWANPEPSHFKWLENCRTKFRSTLNSIDEQLESVTLDSNQDGTNLRQQLLNQVNQLKKQVNSFEYYAEEAMEKGKSMSREFVKAEGEIPKTKKMFVELISALRELSNSQKIISVRSKPVVYSQSYPEI